MFFIFYLITLLLATTLESSNQIGLHKKDLDQDSAFASILDKYNLQKQDKSLQSNNLNQEKQDQYILSHKIQGNNGWIDTVRITEDGHRISLISDRSVLIYHYNNASGTFNPFPNQTITVQRTLWTQDLCRDHERMIIGGTGKMLGSYQLTSDGYKFLGFFQQPIDQIKSIKMTLDGMAFVAAGFIPKPLIYFRNTSAPIGYSLLQELDPIEDSSHASLITPNWEFVIVADGDLFNVYQIRFNQNQTDFQYEKIQTLGKTGKFRITSMCLSIIQTKDRPSQQLYYSQFSNEQQKKIEKAVLVTVSTDQFIRIHHYDSSSNKFVLFQQIHIENKQLLTVSLFVDGKTLAVGTSGKCLLIFQLQSKEQDQIYTAKWIQTQDIPVGTWIRSIRFSVTNGKTLVVGGDDSVLRLYQVGQCKPQEDLINGQCVLKASSLTTPILLVIVGSSVFLITCLCSSFCTYRNRNKIEKMFSKSISKQIQIDNSLLTSALISGKGGLIRQNQSLISRKTNSSILESGVRDYKSLRNSNSQRKNKSEIKVSDHKEDSNQNLQIQNKRIANFKPRVIGFGQKTEGSTARNTTQALYRQVQWDKNGDYQQQSCRQQCNDALIQQKRRKQRAKQSTDTYRDSFDFDSQRK